MTKEEEERINAYLIKDFKITRDIEFHKVVDYLRHIQKEYVEGKGRFSGSGHLLSMVQEGSITLEFAISILPAIEEYKIPYTLSVREVPEEEEVNHHANVFDNIPVNGSNTLTTITPKKDDAL